MTRILGTAIAFLVAAVFAAAPAFAHCDTLDGPVIADAQSALESGDVTPVLKWVAPAYEGDIRDAFDRALAVRSLSGDARELADMYFFETLVRIHREGEGAPYTGIKPHGTLREPGVAEADRAIEEDDYMGLIKSLHPLLQDGIADRLARVVEAKKHAGESTEAGREYVEAYVLFVHYVERLFADAGSDVLHEGHSEGGEAAAAGHAEHEH